MLTENSWVSPVLASGIRLVRLQPFLYLGIGKMPSLYSREDRVRGFAGAIE